MAGANARDLLPMDAYSVRTRPPARSVPEVELLKEREDLKLLLRRSVERIANLEYEASQFPSRIQGVRDFQSVAAARLREVEAEFVRRRQGPPYRCPTCKVDLPSTEAMHRHAESFEHRSRASRGY